MSKLLYFVGGLTVGAAGMYFGMKEYFRLKMDEEIQSVVDYYGEKIHDIENRVEYDKKIADDFDKHEVKKVDRTADPDIEVEPDYNEIIEKLNYNQYSTKTSNDKQRPYIISSEQYADDIEYEKVIISYFSEEEVAMDSETEEVLEDINGELGLSNLEDFGEDNEIYIRNEKLGRDYQVVLENSTYADFLSEYGED